MNILYTKNNGRWLRTEYAEQCKDKNILGNKEGCQGVKGHTDNHWQYRPNGSFFTWMNKDYPENSNLGIDIATSNCPPGHKNYISPESMVDKYFLSHSTTKIVTDPETIKILEEDGFPEEGCSVSRPCTEEGFEKLKEKYRDNDGHLC